MAHYLYVLQSVSLNLYDRRMRTSMDPYSQVGERSPCQSDPASSCGSRGGRGFVCGVCSFPSVFAFVLCFKPRGTCLRGSRWHPSPLLSPQEQRELLQSLRQAAFESESEAPTSNFSTERRRSLCAKEFRKLGFTVRPPSVPLPGHVPVSLPSFSRTSSSSPEPAVLLGPAVWCFPFATPALLNSKCCGAAVPRRDCYHRSLLFLQPLFGRASPWTASG